MIKDIIRLSLRYGAIGILLIVVMFLVFYYSGQNPLEELQMFDLFIIPVFIFFGIKELRDRFNNRILKFWQGMTTGFFIYTSYALGSSLFIWLFTEWVDTSLVSTYIDSRLSLLEETRTTIVEEMGAESYITTYDDVKDTSQYELILDSIFKKMIIGFMITSVVSIVLKKKGTTEEITKKSK